MVQVFVSLASVTVGNKKIGNVAVYTDMTDHVASEKKIEAALKQSEVLNEKLSCNRQLHAARRSQ